MSKVTQNMRAVFRTRQGLTRALIVSTIAAIPNDSVGFSNCVVMRFSDSDRHVTLNAGETVRLAQTLLEATRPA